MTDVILFHHALGVTDGLIEFSDQLREDGHQVTVADLFAGTTFDTIEEGVAHEEQLGWDEMIARSKAALAPLPVGVVIGGLSLGAVYGPRLAASCSSTRARATCSPTARGRSTTKASTMLVVERILAFLDRIGWRNRLAADPLVSFSSATDRCYGRFQLRTRFMTPFDTPSINGLDPFSLLKRSAASIASSFVSCISVKKST